MTRLKASRRCWAAGARLGWLEVWAGEGVFACRTFGCGCGRQAGGAARFILGCNVPLFGCAACGKGRGGLAQFGCGARVSSQRKGFLGGGMLRLPLERAGGAVSRRGSNLTCRV